MFVYAQKIKTRLLLPSARDTPHQKAIIIRFSSIIFLHLLLIRIGRAVSVTAAADPIARRAIAIARGAGERVDDAAGRPSVNVDGQLQVTGVKIAVPSSFFFVPLPPPCDCPQASSSVFVRRPNILLLVACSEAGADKRRGVVKTKIHALPIVNIILCLSPLWPAIFAAFNHPKRPATFFSFTTRLRLLST